MRLIRGLCFSTLLCFQTVFASDYRPDSGAVENYVTKLSYHMLEHKITDPKVQNDLISFLSSVSSKKLSIYVTNYALYKTRLLDKEACLCDGIVVNLKHFNEDLLSNILTEIRSQSLKNDFETLLKKDKDLSELAQLFFDYHNTDKEMSLERLNEAQISMSSLLFFIEFKTAYDLNRYVKAGLPNKDVVIMEDKEIAQKIYEKDIAPLGIEYDEKVLEILSLKARSNDKIEDYLKEIKNTEAIKKKFE